MFIYVNTLIISFIHYNDFIISSQFISSFVCDICLLRDLRTPRLQSQNSCFQSFFYMSPVKGCKVFLQTSFEGSFLLFCSRRNIIICEVFGQIAPCSSEHFFS